FNRGKGGEDGLLMPLRRLRKRPEQVRDMLAACWRLAATENPISERKRNLILLWGRWAGCTPGEVLELQPRSGAQGSGQPRAAMAVRRSSPYEAALELLCVGETAEPGETEQIRSASCSEGAQTRR